MNEQKTNASSGGEELLTALGEIDETLAAEAGEIKTQDYVHRLQTDGKTISAKGTFRSWLKKRNWKKLSAIAAAAACGAIVLGAGLSGMIGKQDAKSEAYSADGASAESYNTESYNTMKSEDVYEYNGFFDEAAKAEDTAEAPEEGIAGSSSLQIASTDTASSAVHKEKLVYRCALDLQTLEYEETLKAIRSRISELGGFIQEDSESDNATGWYNDDYSKTHGTLTAYLSVRIPTENYDAFLGEVSTYGRVLNMDRSVTNISKQYADTETRIESLKIQENRLLEMLKQAETIEDMISVEDRLEEVQYELASYKNMLSGMDLDTAYSTITMQIREVVRYSALPSKVSTFGDRLKNTVSDSFRLFGDFLEGILFFIITVLPEVIVIGGIILLIVFLHRRRKSARSVKKAIRSEKDS